MKKILPFYYEQTFHMHDLLFKQGTDPEYVYVICDGDVELIREKKPHRVLIDPTENKLGPAAKKMTVNTMKTHLEHLSPDKGGHKREAFMRNNLIES